jgi:hypothetical protein
VEEIWRAGPDADVSALLIDGEEAMVRCIFAGLAGE